MKLAFGIFLPGILICLQVTIFLAGIFDSPGGEKPPFLVYPLSGFLLVYTISLGETCYRQRMMVNIFRRTPYPGGMVYWIFSLFAVIMASGVYGLFTVIAYQGYLPSLRQNSIYPGVFASLLVLLLHSRYAYIIYASNYKDGQTN
jgi:hypothetical protein